MGGEYYYDYDAEAEIERLKREVSKEESRTAECQQEISRLRAVVRENSEEIRKMDRVKILDVEFDVSVCGRFIGSVMEEAWNKALDLDARRLSFSFNSHQIIIEKEVGIHE